MTGNNAELWGMKSLKLFLLTVFLCISYFIVLLFVGAGIQLNPCSRAILLVGTLTFQSCELILEKTQETQVEFLINLSAEYVVVIYKFLKENKYIWFI